MEEKINNLLESYCAGMISVAELHGEIISAQDEFGYVNIASFLNNNAKESTLLALGAFEASSH